MKDENTKKDIIKITLALLVLVFFMGLKLYDNYRDAKIEAEISSKRILVKEPSRYFTVIGCIDKYLKYVQNNDIDNIWTILNSEYKNEFNIKKDYIYNYIPNLNDGAIYTYKGYEMESKKVSKNITEYYVNGKIKRTIMDESDTFIDYDFTVILYENEMLFSIRPGVKNENQ